MMTPTHKPDGPLDALRFLGDLFLDQPADLPKIRRFAERNPLPTILNLEGAFEGPERRSKLHVLTHHPEAVWEALAALDTRAVSLCNNHVFDRGALAFRQLADALDEHGFGRFGAGSSLDEALRPFVLERPGSDPLIFLGFGCAHEMCPPASARRPGSAPLEEDLILAQLKRWRDHGRIILQLHWGHEYEEQPLPLHRGMARRFAAAGASAIIGHHAHQIQRFEVLDGVPVYYGLGNFYFSRLGEMFTKNLQGRTWGLRVDLELADFSTRAQVFDILSLEDVDVDPARYGLDGVPAGAAYEAWFDVHRTSRHKPRLADGQPLRNTLVWEAFRAKRAVRRFKERLAGQRSWR